ncbi:MAG: carbon-nitrogen hydrolase family protein [Hyphomicrobiales bacterium]
MSGNGKFRAACVQLRTGRSVPDNIEAAAKFVREAAAEGADYVLTPEQTALMELEREALFAGITEEAADPTLARMRPLAKELGIYIHIGSVAVKVGPEKAANRAFLIAPDGSIAARYDKIHMFDVDLPGGENYRESRTYQAGDKAVVADLPWGRLGFSICYDLRFAYLYRTLAKAGAHFLTSPAAFTRQTGEAHWHVLQRARAIETGCFVFTAAQGGHHENGRDTFGHSMIIDPWGRIIAEAGTDPTVIIADIDPALVAEARGRVPALTHDREVTLSVAKADT